MLTGDARYIAEEDKAGESIQWEEPGEFPARHRALALLAEFAGQGV